MRACRYVETPNSPRHLTKKALGMGANDYGKDTWKKAMENMEHQEDGMCIRMYVNLRESEFFYRTYVSCMQR
jgi:hypothetical protein